MLLTLAASSLSSHLDPHGEGGLTVFDLPGFAIRELRLRGLNLTASMLAGWSYADLDRLRDRADKAACPCLVLVEDTPLPLADPSSTGRDEAKERIRRLAAAANRLGCNALALKCAAPDDPRAFDLLAEEMKAVMPSVERLELNVLLAPNEGLTDCPDRLTELIKRIGGFRIGSLPNFAHAASTGDPVSALRKLAPYAGAIHATVGAFSRRGKHEGYDLAECVAAVRSVGFPNTLAIEYVGDGDPIKNIDRARTILQAAIDGDQ
ncbi:MAG: sugar phosphate isomerase/epimerase [Phycisphaerales bacterium]|nr:MAG: sugar phosphate isomerase/epimerase [Phycisphaerales bacterium]